jgi:hypothetical protein
MTPNAALRLIRRVQGPCGSFQLYWHPRRLQIVEVLEVRDGDAQILELSRYPDDMLPELQRYCDEVEKGIADGMTKPKVKRTRRLARGGMWAEGSARRAKLSAGGE